MTRVRVAVLMGGKSPEHEISLASGREVVRHLDPKKYDVLPIIVSRDGISWQIGEENFKFQISNFKLNKRGVADMEGLPTAHSLKAKSPSAHSARKRALAGRKQLTGPRAIEEVDVVFIAMHGPYGEDGTIQGFLELIGVPYTGSGVLASALGMDKVSSRKLFTQAGLKTPKYSIIKKGRQISRVWKSFTPPIFIKPHNQGSSIGASIVSRTKNLAKALKLAWTYSNLAIIEEFIDGTEVTGAIIGNEKPKALPLVEIVPKKVFFDYEAKYNERFCDEIVPARIGKSLAKKARDAALKAYQSLSCRGFGRVDMIIRGNDIYVLELNTIPGLTPVSLVPKAAKAAGISYPQLLDKIIEFATP